MSTKPRKIEYYRRREERREEKFKAEEYPIVFRGEGLKELNEIAEMYDIPRGEAVIKALKLLKITKKQGSGRLTFKEGNQEISIDSNKL